MVSLDYKDVTQYKVETSTTTRPRKLPNSHDSSGPGDGRIDCRVALAGHKLIQITWLWPVAEDKKLYEALGMNPCTIREVMQLGVGDLQQGDKVVVAIDEYKTEDSRLQRIQY